MQSCSPASSGMMLCEMHGLLPQHDVRQVAVHALHESKRTLRVILQYDDVQEAIHAALQPSMNRQDAVCDAWVATHDVKQDADHAEVQQSMRTGERHV